MQAVFISTEMCSDLEFLSDTYTITSAHCTQLLVWFVNLQNVDRFAGISFNLVESFPNMTCHRRYFNYPCHFKDYFSACNSWRYQEDAPLPVGNLLNWYYCLAKPFNVYFTPNEVAAETVRLCCLTSIKFTEQSTTVDKLNCRMFQPEGFCQLLTGWAVRWEMTTYD